MAVQSFTSRADPIPINGVILEIDGGYDTTLTVEASTATEGSGDGAKVESRAIPKISARISANWIDRRSWRI